MLSNYVVGDGEGWGDIVVVRFSNNINVGVSWEVFIESVVKNSCYGFEGVVVEVVINIEGVYVEVVVMSLLENSVGIVNSLVEGYRIRGVRVDVEVDFYNVEFEFFGSV